MKINSDLSYNVYTTYYLTPTTTPSFIPYPSVVVPAPKRNEVTNVYTNFLAGNFFTNNDLQNQTTPIFEVIVPNGAYHTGNLSAVSFNVYFFQSSTKYRLRNSGLNYNLANTFKTLGPSPGEYQSFLGTALVNQDLCYFKFSTNAPIPQDLSGAMRIGYTGNDSSTIETNTYFEFSQSESLDPAPPPPPLALYELYRRRGWYLGVDVSNLSVENIELNIYPDICNNSFNPWEIQFGQYFPNNTQASTPLQYDLAIAKKPLTDISLNGFSETHANPALTQDFFGLNRPNGTPVFDASLSGIFTNMNIWWRPSNTLMVGELKYALSNSGGSGNFIDNYSIPWPYTPQPAFYNISLPPNQPTIVELALTYITTTYKYSRDRNFTPQFYIEGKYTNNITYTSPVTPNPSILDISFNNKPLWWDYTFNLNTSLNKSVGGQFPTTGVTYTSSYDHTLVLDDSQLMWANNYFRPGNSPAQPTNTNNPYIDYTNFFNPGQSYATKDTAGVSISANFTSPGIAIVGSAGQRTVYWNSPNSTPNLSGTYKFIMIESTTPSVTNDKYVDIDILEDNTSLNKGDYIIYIQEESAGFIAGSTIPTGYTSGYSGWKNGLGKINSGWGPEIQNSNDAGTWNSTLSKHQLFVSTSHKVYYRIGLIQNSSDIFNKVTIQYYDNNTATGSLQTYDYRN